MIEAIENINQTSLLICLVTSIFIMLRDGDSVSDIEKYVAVSLMLAGAVVSVVSVLLLIWH